MLEIHPHSPEERRKRLVRLRARFGREAMERARKEIQPLIVGKRVAVGLYDDGFIHAGNLAYLSLLAIFPFIILAAAVARLLNETDNVARAVTAILSRLPPQAADVLRAPIQEVLEARSGSLLWLGAIVGLWTAASYVETIRDILRRAYGTRQTGTFWQYRLGSMALILGSVILLLLSFTVTVFMSSIQHLVIAHLPAAQGVADEWRLYKIGPMLTLFVTFYVLFLVLTPARYRTIENRKWPGALLVTLWWFATAEILPEVVGWFGGYERTYGSLGGVIVVLLFFFFIGLGVVAGAELNAALAEPRPTALKGEHYEGPFEDQIEVDEPVSDERTKKNKG